MQSRADLKQQSRDKILNAAARRIREEGLKGSGIAAVMADAGLTHGAFYAHFSNKEAMLSAALSEALDGNRARWISQPANEGWGQRLKRLASRYLTPGHRDNLHDSCALTALSSDAGRSTEGFKVSYEQELIKTLSAICGTDFQQASAQQQAEAMAFFSMLVGSLALSRAVSSDGLSAQLLQAGAGAAERLAQPHGGECI